MYGCVKTGNKKALIAKILEVHDHAVPVGITSLHGHEFHPQASFMSNRVNMGIHGYHWGRGVPRGSKGNMVVRGRGTAVGMAFDPA